MKNYIALFEKVPGKDGYGVVFPDFPGCISAGDDYEDAVQMAHEALAGHVECMRRDGDQVPSPRTLEEIKATWKDWAEWEQDYDFVISYIKLLPSKGTMKRVNVMLDERLLSQIDAVSKNRSSFLADAARRLLGTVL